jgi:L-threonylcarbamoyladenylate synthase
VIPYRTDIEIEAAIPGAVGHLVRQGLISYPTETVYGLGSTVWAGAVGRLAALKGREPGKPFLLLVAGPEMLHDVGLRLTDAADRFASAFWPGPLTLVLPGGEGRLPELLRGPEGGIAVRWTSHPGAARLIATLGSPITSTSANQPGKPAATDAAEVARTFAGAVTEGSLLVLNAGPLAPSKPSTVVDCIGVAPRLIRRGALDPARLKAIVPALVE